MTSEYIAHTETSEGLTLKIIQDDHGGTDSPLEYDEPVIFAVLHRRYENPAKDKRVAKPFGHGDYDFTTTEGLQAFEKANAHKNAPYAVFPLFMYDHSGTSYRCSEGGNPFSCPWDSGRVGLIALRKTEVGDPKTCGKSYYQQAQDVCDTYTSWANGEIYGYVVEDAEGEHLDSCWGFIGDPNGYVLDEGRISLAHYVGEAREKQARTLESERPDMYNPLTTANVALHNKAE